MSGATPASDEAISPLIRAYSPGSLRAIYSVSRTKSGIFSVLNRSTVASISTSASSSLLRMAFSSERTGSLAKPPTTIDSGCVFLPASSSARL